MKNLLPCFRTIRQRAFNRIRYDMHGVALIEFAMVFPVLIILYLGGFQLMEGASVYRKVTTATRSIADLTAQSTSVSQNDLQTYLDASAQVMAPYTASKGTYRVTLVDVDAAGVAKVAWSKSKSGAGQYAPGDDYTLPASIKQNGMSVIICDVVYTYEPIAFFSMMGNIPFADRIFMVPRGSSTIILRD